MHPLRALDPADPKQSTPPCLRFAKLCKDPVASCCNSRGQDMRIGSTIQRNSEVCGCHKKNEVAAVFGITAVVGDSQLPNVPRLSYEILSLCPR